MFIDVFCKLKVVGTNEKKTHRGLVNAIPRPACRLPSLSSPHSHDKLRQVMEKNNNLQPSFLRLPFFIPLGPLVYVIGISTCTLKRSAW